MNLYNRQQLISTRGALSYLVDESKNSSKRIPHFRVVVCLFVFFFIDEWLQPFEGLIAIQYIINNEGID